MVHFICILFIFLQDLSLYLPDTFGGYKKEDMEEYIDPFSGCTHVIKNYRKGSSELTVTLVDYQNAPEIFESTLNVWSSMTEVEDANLRSGRTSIKDFQAWETIRKKEKASEVVIAINGRYLLTIQCLNAPLNEAVSIAHGYSFNWLKR